MILRILAYCLLVFTFFLSVGTATAYIEVGSTQGVERAAAVLGACASGCLIYLETSNDLQRTR